MEHEDYYCEVIHIIYIFSTKMTPYKMQENLEYTTQGMVKLQPNNKKFPRKGDFI